MGKKLPTICLTEEKLAEELARLMKEEREV